MRVRELEKKDYLIIKEMLKKEGAEDEYSYVIKAKTYIMEDGDIIGFFGYKMEHGLPSLKHFCLNRKHRGLGNACRMMREYVKIIRKEGHEKSIFTASEELFTKLLEWFFKMTPYAKINGINFYIKDLSEGV